MEIHCLKWGHTCARLKNVVKKATIFILMCYSNELGLNTVCHMLNEHFFTSPRYTRRVSSNDITWRSFINAITVRHTSRIAFSETLLTWLTGTLVWSQFYRLRGFRFFVRSIMIFNIERKLLKAKVDLGKVFDGIHGHINELDAFLFNNIDLIEKVRVQIVKIVPSGDVG